MERQEGRAEKWYDLGAQSSPDGVALKGLLNGSPLAAFGSTTTDPEQTNLEGTNQKKSNFTTVARSLVSDN